MRTSPFTAERPHWPKDSGTGAYMAREVGRPGGVEKDLSALGQLIGFLSAIGLLTGTHFCNFFNLALISVINY